MPFDGLGPTSPQNAGGIRADPPPSVGVAIGTMPADSAAAEPPLDPPGDHSRPQGLRVGPNTRLAGEASNAFSGRFVLPTTMPPAARSRPGTRPSRAAGGSSACSSEPRVVV